MTLDVRRNQHGSGRQVTCFDGPYSNASNDTLQCPFSGIVSGSGPSATIGMATGTDSGNGGDWFQRQAHDKAACSLPPRRRNYVAAVISCQLPGRWQTGFCPGLLGGRSRMGRTGAPSESMPTGTAVLDDPLDSVLSATTTRTEAQPSTGAASTALRIRHNIAVWICFGSAYSIRGCAGGV